MLIAGVTLAQPAKKGTSGDDHKQNPFLGLVAVLSACCSSGFAGVYFEKMLKGSSKSLWIRNIQLATWSILLGTAGCLIKDSSKILADGFFQGYNMLTIFIVCMQAGGGILVAVVVKYSDNIIKGFATSLSIIVSSVLSAMFFDFSITLSFVLGATLVLSAVFLYGYGRVLNTTKEEISPDSLTAVKIRAGEAQV